MASASVAVFVFVLIAATASAHPIGKERIAFQNNQDRKLIEAIMNLWKEEVEKSDQDVAVKSSPSSSLWNKEKATATADQDTATAKSSNQWKKEKAKVDEDEDTLAVKRSSLCNNQKATVDQDITAAKSLNSRKQENEELNRDNFAAMNVDKEKIEKYAEDQDDNRDIQ